MGGVANAQNTAKEKRKKVLLRARLSENEGQLATNQDVTTPQPTPVLGRSQYS